MNPPASVATAIATILALTSGVSYPCEGQNVRLVNVIPKRYSGESRNNPESSVAIHPTDHAIAMFAAHLPGNDLCVNSTRSGFFVSKSHGDNWTLWCALTEKPDKHPGDLTTRFSGDGSWMHVAHLLRSQLRLVGTTDLESPSSVSDLLTSSFSSVKNRDQPQLQTRPDPGATDLALALIEWTFSAPGPKPCRHVRLFYAQQTTDPLEFQDSCLDFRSDPRPFAVRIAMHADGTTYVAFLPVQKSASDTVGSVVIVRGMPSVSMSMSDAVESGSTGCSADGLPGVQIVCGIDVPFDSGFNPDFGWEVRQGSLAIAVDPTDSKKVYVAWGDRSNPKSMLTVHVRRSVTGGDSWDSNDLWTVENATNPALAVDAGGRLGFLYQQFVKDADPRWHTRFRWTATADTPGNDIIIADTPAGPKQQPSGESIPFQGDYANLIAIDKDFFGAFSAWNDPDMVRFPYGARYNRRCSGGNLVAKSGAGVKPSVDPFFVHVQPDKPSNLLASGTGLSC